MNMNESDILHQEEVALLREIEEAQLHLGDLRTRLRSVRASIKALDNAKGLPAPYVEPESYDETAATRLIMEIFALPESSGVIPGGVYPALQTLNPRERRVLIHRFGLDGHRYMTLLQTGQLYGISRERVRLLEAKAFLKLRHPTRRRYLLAAGG